SGSPTLHRYAAWPLALLHDAAGRPVRGFLMPYFRGLQPAHHPYNPAQRQHYFPQADWSFPLLAAPNCPAPFEEVHATDALVGDVNQSNVLVSDKALVALIDCDSFQVRADGRVFRCEVGVAHYTPPELQNARFRDIDRTLNHDRFGL